MCRIKISASVVSLFLSMCFLAAVAFTPTLFAQAAGSTVTVKMIDAVDSSKDQLNKQYRASLTKAVDTGNGVTIPQGAVATMTLVNSSNGSGWTMQLVSVSINGQPVAVTSGPASVATTAQTNAGIALNSMNSALARFGHHVNAPAAATAIATGQRVVLPPGTTLTFLLSQPPTGNSAAPSVAAPSAPQTVPPSTVPVAAQGQHWWLCQYVDPKDINKPVLGQRVYFSVFPSNASSLDAGGNASAMAKHFIAYVQQNYKVVTALALTPSGEYNGRAGGYCKRSSDDASTRANSMDMTQKQWASSTPKIEAIQVDFADTTAQDAAIDAKAGAAALPGPTTASTGGPFIICSTSGGPGMDTYLTGAFQTTRVKHTPSGGNLVDQSILDDFYAYLTQKGYKFKPGSNYGCAVKPTEEAAKADEDKRQSGCSNCGKIVETGWTDN